MDEAERELLVKTSRVDDPYAALAACLQYCVTYPKSPACLHAALTMDVVRHAIARRSASSKAAKRGGPHQHELTSLVLDLVNQPLPGILANGLVTVARTRDENKALEANRLFLQMEESDSRELQVLYDESQLESERLEVQGDTLARTKGISRERAFADAEVYYRAYQQGQFKDAKRGFDYLKQLNPHESYFRNMLGASLSKLKEPRAALREWLWAFKLDPQNLHVAKNLMEQLIKDSLLLPLIAIYGHHTRHSRPAAGEEEERKVLERYCRYASFVVTVLACGSAKIGADDLDVTAVDQLDRLQLPPRPWLVEPTAEDERPASELTDKSIFISYRRTESADLAMALRERLKLAEPSLYVFLDEAEMAAGGVFRAQLRDEIKKADILLVLIGRSWGTSEGQARLNENGDVLRRELAMAFAYRVPVIPVLIQEATMPTADALPYDVRKLADIQAVRLRPGNLQNDVRNLMMAMRGVVNANQRRKNILPQRMKEFEEMEKRDPAGAEKAREQWLEKQMLPLAWRMETRKARLGIGVPLGLVSWNGVWECSGICTNGDRLSLRFTIQRNSGPAAMGVFQRSARTGKVIAKHDFRAECVMIESEDRKLSLGFRLECLVEGIDPFDIQIPFHAHKAGSFTGRDDDGTIFTSRNVDSYE